MPLGGIGTGQVALAGDGALRQWQLFNAIDHTATLPGSFFAIRIARPEPPLDVVRVLQSQEVLNLSAEHTPLVNDDHIPEWQRQLLARVPGVERTTFRGLYPRAVVEYQDKAMPVAIELTANAPWIPHDAEASSLPMVLFRFRIRSTGTNAIYGALGAAIQNAVGWDGLTEIDGARCALYGGNVNRLRWSATRTDLLMDNPNLPDDHPGNGQMVLSALTPAAMAYERWTDPLHFIRFLEGNLVGRQSARSALEFARKRHHSNVLAVPDGPSPTGQTWNAGLAVPFELQPDQEIEVTFVLSWHFPNRYVSFDQERFETRDYGRSRFWVGNAYAERFPDALAVLDHVESRLEELEGEGSAWLSVLEQSTMPPWLTEAMAAQGSLIRSPTCFQTADGKFFGFEGSLGASTSMWNAQYGGSCPLNCTHVWGYEQALSRLFPALERTMRETDYEHVQAADGHLPHRTVLPLYLPQYHGEKITGPERPALDGMLTTVLKSYREVRQGAGQAWLSQYWPNMKDLVDYVQRTWDPNDEGTISGEQPCTFDISLFGTELFCGSLWLAALRAAEEMARAVGEDSYATELGQRFDRGSRRYDELLWNGDYYEQTLTSSDIAKPFQYGAGCLSDQLIGQWWAHQLELGYLLPREHVRVALAAIVRHNFRTTFRDFKHGYRVFADGEDRGLLVCSWPRGARPDVPIRYADEVWTGSEYQVAAHCLMEGLHEEGMLVLKALCDRYDGRRRNPYNHIECGDHYARAMAGWSVVEALSHLRYDALAARLTIVEGGTTGRYPFVAASGWGLVTFSEGKIEVDLRYGELLLREVRCPGFTPTSEVASLRAGERMVLTQVP